MGDCRWSAHLHNPPSPPSLWSTDPCRATCPLQRLFPFKTAVSFHVSVGFTPVSWSTPGLRSVAKCTRTDRPGSRPCRPLPGCVPLGTWLHHPGHRSSCLHVGSNKHIPARAAGGRECVFSGWVHTGRAGLALGSGVLWAVLSPDAVDAFGKESLALHLAWELPYPLHFFSDFPSSLWKVE